MLLPQASMLDEADQLGRALLTDDLLYKITELIPDDWLRWPRTTDTPEAIRDIYFRFMKTRLQNSHLFLNSAYDAKR